MPSLPGSIGPGRWAPGQSAPGQSARVNRPRVDRPGSIGPGRSAPGSIGLGSIGPGSIGPGRSASGQSASRSANDGFGTRFRSSASDKVHLLAEPAHQLLAELRGDRLAPRFALELWRAGCAARAPTRGRGGPGRRSRCRRPACRGARRTRVWMAETDSTEGCEVGTRARRRGSRAGSRKPRSASSRRSRARSRWRRA